MLRAWQVSQAVVDSLPGPPHEIVNVDLVAEDAVDLLHGPAREQDCIAILCTADANLDCLFHWVAAFLDGLAKLIDAQVGCSRDSYDPDRQPPAASPNGGITDHSQLITKDMAE